MSSVANELQDGRRIKRNLIDPRGAGSAEEAPKVGDTARRAEPFGRIAPPRGWPPTDDRLEQVGAARRILRKSRGQHKSGRRQPLSVPATYSGRPRVAFSIWRPPPPRTMTTIEISHRIWAASAAGPRGRESFNYGHFRTPKWARFAREPQAKGPTGANGSVKRISTHRPVGSRPTRAPPGGHTKTAPRGSELSLDII